ncbi:FAD:protein FMN transferase [Spirochaetia bacterium]|nr:FAD:protein FMN transferase [Spirochaetia bacterium]
MRLQIKVIVTILVLFISGCARSTPHREFVLGTICSVNLYEYDNRETINKIFSRLREIEDIFSANKDGTEIDKINKSSGIAPVKVSDELIRVLERSVYFAELSSGAFDPTIGTLVKLWGIGGDNAAVPAQTEINMALTLVDWRLIEIDKENKTVFLAKEGMALDLGGIAKGYAADQAAIIARNAGVKKAIIDLGGNIYAIGKKQTKSFFKKDEPWKIGVQNPNLERGNFIGVAAVQDSTLVTSGVYERYFESEGNRYHHILSTGTGFPAESGLLSVTITNNAADNATASMDADALSTAVFILGEAKGKELLKNFETASAVFVHPDGTITTSGDFDFVKTED